MSSPVQRAPASGVYNFAGGQSPASQAFGSDVTLGNTLIAYYVGVDPAATESLSISDNLNGGQSWTPLFAHHYSGNLYHAAWLCVANANGACTVSVTGGSNAYQNGVVLIELSGALTLDQVSAAVDSDSANPAVTNPITTTHAIEMILAFGADVNGFSGGNAGSAVAPFALATNGGWSYISNYPSAQIDYYSVTSIQTGLTASMGAGGDASSVVLLSLYPAAPPQVATPTFSPVAGAYGPAQNVTISDTDNALGGFQIYYTTNGDTPDNTKTAYTYGTTVAISASHTLKAIAYATGYANSAVGSAAYTINGAVATPTFSPGTESHDGAVTVTITCSDSALSGFGMRYTTDDTTPTESYGTTIASGGTVVISNTDTLKAIAYATNYSDSAVRSATYTITFTLSGNAGVAGATVVLTGTVSASTTSAGDGSYSFTGLPVGSYTITPTKIVYLFTPTSANETVSTADVTGINFTAEQHGNVYDPTIDFVGTVSTDGSGSGPYIGHVRVIVAAPSGFSNPYLGKVSLGTARGDSSDKYLGQVVVIGSAPSAQAPDLGNAGQI